MDKIKVLIADDHAIVRMGLAALFETEDDIELVGEADDGVAAVRKALRLKPDVVIMDLMMPEMDGIAATARIRDELPDTKVLILTTSTVSDEISRALKAGATGALIKSSVNAKLLSAIRAVAAGRRAVSNEIEELLAHDPPAPELTARQVEILSSITRGLTNSDISKQLGIAPDSVKEHVNAILSKIGAANRAEAVAIALRKHLLKI